MKDNEKPLANYCIRVAITYGALLHINETIYVLYDLIIIKLYVDYVEYALV